MRTALQLSVGVVFEVIVVIATIHNTSIILLHIGRQNLLHLVAVLEPFGRLRLLIIDLVA